MKGKKKKFVRIVIPTAIVPFGENPVISPRNDGSGLADVEFPSRRLKFEELSEAELIAYQQASGAGEQYRRQIVFKNGTVIKFNPLPSGAKPVGLNNPKYLI